MIVAEQAVVAGPHAGAVAVAVAATLRGTVAADEAEVAAAVVGLHTRAVHATLGAHWAAQPRHAVGRGWGAEKGNSAYPSVSPTPTLAKLFPPGREMQRGVGEEALVQVQVR